VDLSARGVEVELAVLLVLTCVGQTVFARFEIETATWRKRLKWFVVYALTLGFYAGAGHWAAAVPVFLGGLGVAGHVVWCRRHQIHPLTAQTLERYYALRGWRWPPQSPTHQRDRRYNNGDNVGGRRQRP
jgi:hypothetical protein